VVQIKPEIQGQKMGEGGRERGGPGL